MLSLLAAAPALPLDEAGKYVAGAYIVFVVLLIVYVGIMASKLQRIERELGEVAEIAEQRKAEADGTPAEAAAAPDQSTRADRASLGA
jgi:Na+-transporting methylmalonyl-CoA/oxaloacetate decarboxylase gamma subunit